MSYQFGTGDLYLLRNLLLTGGAVTTGTSATVASNFQVSSGALMIDGVTAIVSAQSAQIPSGAGLMTGSGLLVYAYITSTDTITASVAILSASHPVNTSIGIPTAICPLARLSFGTGAISLSTIVVYSGGSATKTIGKVQNVQINVGTEQAQMRGGGDVYPVDTQHFNGSIEGSFEMADPTSTQFLLLGGQYDSGGASSGTWTLSGVSRPEPVSLVFVNVTNGITSTHTVLRAYLTQSTLGFSRTDYMNPSFNFVGQANNQGNAYRITQ